MPEQECDTAIDLQEPGAKPLFALQQHLFLALAGDKPMGGGARIGLAELDEVVVGRGETRTFTRRVIGGARQLVVALPGKQLSGTHARLVRVSSRWTIEDCHSTNGTFVNGERIERTTLADQDILELGRTVLIFRDAVPTPLGAPADLDTRALTDELRGMATLLPANERDLGSLKNIARSPLPVLLLGESGTGKEVLAQAIHTLSARPGALVPVNCAAIPATLLESQLFGHVRGAFSGAVRDEIGLVRAADQGTLFLDEIGDLPAGAQAALLRMLQEGEVQPVGSTRTVKVQVRVLAATHRPLARLVENGQFRGDLFARLNGYAHALPPLRKRMEDLPILCASILPRVAPDGGEGVTFATATIRALLQYSWPMNVRELQQVLARAVVLSGGERIEPGHLPAELKEGPRGREAGSRTLSDQEQKDEDLRRELLALMEKHGGNVSEVARSMGKARMQIQRWIKRFDLQPRRTR